MVLCEYCGNFLNTDGRCPWEDCPHNAIIDAMVEAEEKEKGQYNMPSEKTKKKP